MGRKRNWIARWQKAFNRRDFLIATYTAVLGWGLSRYFPAPAPVIKLPPIIGTLNVALDPLVASPYILTAKAGSFALSGDDVAMWVSAAATV